MAIAAGADHRGDGRGQHGDAHFGKARCHIAEAAGWFGHRGPRFRVARHDERVIPSVRGVGAIVMEFTVGSGCNGELFRRPAGCPEYGRAAIFGRDQVAVSPQCSRHHKDEVVPRDARSERVSRAAASRRPLPSAVQALVGCPRKAPLARDAAESRPRSPLGEACTLRDRHFLGHPRSARRRRRPPRPIGGRSYGTHACSKRYRTSSASRHGAA